jgi:hypothetical protein
MQISKLKLTQAMTALASLWKKFRSQSLRLQNDCRLPNGRRSTSSALSRVETKYLVLPT